MNTPFHVVKIGGAALEAESALNDLLAVAKVALSKQQPVILVHGGGTQVNQLCAKLGLTVEKINGLRVSPLAHMPYITAGLAGMVNKQLVALAQKVGCSGVGLSLADGALGRAQLVDDSLGQVGRLDHIDPALIMTLCEQGHLPIINPIALDEHFQLTNVNADDAAVVIAKQLGAKLTLLSDVPGVMDKQNMLIKHIDPVLLAQLTANQTIVDGMLVKVEAAMTLSRVTGQPVTIGHWRNTSLIDTESEDVIATRIQYTD